MKTSKQKSIIDQMPEMRWYYAHAQCSYFCWIDQHHEFGSRCLECFDDGSLTLVKYGVASIEISLQEALRIYKKHFKLKNFQ